MMAEDIHQWLRQSVSIQQFVDTVLAYASSCNSSDIHIEPFGKALRIRLRCDGVLMTLGDMPREHLEAVTARIKVMAGLDIANKRLPQDGRVAWHHGEKTLDLRISTMPTVGGEKTVIRLLDGTRTELRLESLGMDDRTVTLLRHIIQRKSGLWLAAGPTGSGKTSTLYAAIQDIVHDSIHIATLEDPVEYLLPGISQSQVNPKQGLFFHNGLRALLRQDPDVLVIGEIRDAETAQIAVRAALTGHAVFSTIHTATAVEVPLRLIDMGVAPYLVAAALQGITAQGLARRLCPAWGAGHAEEPPGCPQCFHRGYRGRFCLCEIIPVRKAMEEAIRQGANRQGLTQAAAADGAIFLADAAAAAVARGWTTETEIRRIYTA